MTNKRKAAPTKPPREYKVRLSYQIAQEIEEVADRSGVSINRVIGDRLVSFEHMGLMDSLRKVTTQLTQLFTRYGSRMTQIELSEGLMRAVDEVLSAKPAELPAKLDKLRLVRGEIQDFERSERELATFIKVVRERERLQSAKE